MADRIIIKKSPINEWRPSNPKEVIVKADGKLFICNFKNAIPDYQRPLNKEGKEIENFEKFYINKNSYESQLGIITQYANFFMNVYDTDNELVLAYLKIKEALDAQEMFTEEDVESYIDFIYTFMFTPTIVSKIKQMVDDNYIDDIECTDETKKKYVKNDRKHLESLEFTNIHIKILLAISFGMKIMSPCLFHYLYINKMKIESGSDIIYRFYKRLFKIFGIGNTYDHFDDIGHLLEENIDPAVLKNMHEAGEVYVDYDDMGHPFYTDFNTPPTYYRLSEINMYNKLFVYVKTKVQESNANNQVMFEQREIFGVDLYSVIRQFTNKVIISENVVKYKFNSEWDSKQKKFRENIIGFNKTIIKYQLSYFLKDQYSKTLTEVSTVKNAEGLSGVDKMLMNMTKVDEGAILNVDLNIETTIKKIRQMYDVEVTEDEIAFYMKHHNPSDIQVDFVRDCYAKLFGGYRDLKALTKRQYIELLIILKKMLMFELGFELYDGEIYSAALPYLLTGNLTDKVNNRIIRNNGFSEELNDNYMYQELLNDKYADLLTYIKPDLIIQRISSFVNTKFTYVDYDNRESLGKYIECTREQVADNILFVLKNIV